jgi:3-hydroxyacyl-[acyl-carrier-protein] dehydratase
MKLLDDFFRIRSCKETTNAFEFEVELNAAHVIYQAHFPGHPVTPGVIQMQMVQELMELKLNQQLNVAEVRQCKFLNVLNPEQNVFVSISVEYGKTSSGYWVKATSKTETGPVFKMETEYRLQ